MMDHSLRGFIDVECAEIGDKAVYRFTDLFRASVASDHRQPRSHRGGTARPHQLRRHSASLVVSDPPYWFLPIGIVDAAIFGFTLATDQSPESNETIACSRSRLHRR